jgi:L-ribulose-5-phosphate 4-epimerase
VRYEALQPEQMVVLDLDGKVIEGTLSPRQTPLRTCISTATDRTWVASYTHTRPTPQPSALGKPIPVYLTAQADEFGGQSPARVCAIGGSRSEN